jgi:putative inorganic carbon (hco3(-)) transporter
MHSLPPPKTTYLPSDRGGDTDSSSTTLLLIVAALLVPCGVAYSLGTVNELQVIAVIIGLMGLCAILARPHWGLLLFVGLLYIRPEDSISALAGMHFTLIVSLVTLVGAILMIVLQRLPLVRTPVNGLILGFVLMAVLSNFEEVSSTIQEIGKLGLLVLLILNLVRSPQFFRSLITTLLACSVYLAVFSIYLYFSGGALNEHGVDRSQATGIFNNPNDLADTISAGLALSFGRMLSERGWRRLFYCLTTPLMIWAILITHSRGGLIAMLLVCACTLLYYIRNKIAAIVVISTLFIIIFGAASGRGTNFDADEESAHSRPVFWHNALNQLAAHPITGVGYGAFPELNHGLAAHNSFVTCFTEIGLPGFFCWTGCLYYAFRRRGKSSDETPSGAVQPRPEESELFLRSVRLDAYIVQIAFGGFLIGSFTSNHTYSAVLYLLMSACIVSHSVCEGAFAPLELTRDERISDLKRIAFLCVGLIGIIYGIANTLG